MIADDVMADMVRIARALIKGFRSLQSYTWRSYPFSPQVIRRERVRDGKAYRKETRHRLRNFV
jgi:hypothetical protein